MAILYKLTPELRRRLKKPIGRLVRGSFSETMEKIKDLVEKEEPPMIISVGDTVSKNLTKENISPKVSIVDNKVMRKRIQPIPLKADRILHAQNPPGTITEEAVTAIKEALLYNGHAKIVIDGEEDLLTLVVVRYALENSFVIYGQPLEGVVVVKVTKEKKEEIAGILKKMGKFRKAK